MTKRFSIIKRYVEGKDVLDIGSIGNYNDSLFYSIKPYCKSIIGIDIREGQDKSIIVADMQYCNLNRQFDVVVAGDVIEHVENQGIFVENIAQHLVNSGILIVSTPNARSLAPFLSFLSKGSRFHTMWHDRNTIKNILKKHFIIKNVFYIPGNRKIYSIFNNIPLLNKNGMIVVAEKKVI
ncbi:MAG: methyltransferase domain-containing protein [Oligoflexia bacterium]|nr:methyltransferase domain-containing protein [Oligoflexia bacterium]